ncbi:MAG: hypothetical protein ACOZCL_01775 [Bacillota bacterium]
MRLRKYIETYLLVRGLTRRKQRDENKLDLFKEKCENYFRCDDEEDDGRGNY